MNQKYTKDIHDQIVLKIKEGGTQRAAALAVGLTPETLSIWKKNIRLSVRILSGRQLRHSCARRQFFTRWARMAMRGLFCTGSSAGAPQIGAINRNLMTTHIVGPNRWMGGLPKRTNSIWNGASG